MLAQKIRNGRAAIFWWRRRHPRLTAFLGRAIDEAGMAISDMVVMLYAAMLGGQTVRFMIYPLNEKFPPAITPQLMFTVMALFLMSARFVPEIMGDDDGISLPRIIIGLAVVVGMAITCAALIPLGI